MNASKRLTGIFLTASFLVPVPSLSRELAVELELMRPAELVEVVVLPDGSGAAVALQVRDPDRTVPIFIGPVEAAAILRADQGVRPARPMTHELLDDLLTATGVRVLRLVIDDVRDDVFHAALEVRDAQGRRQWLDARPSDGLVLAVRHRVPILISNALVDTSPEAEDEQASEPILTRI